MVQHVWLLQSTRMSTAISCFLRLSQAGPEQYWHEIESPIRYVGKPDGNRGNPPDKLRDYLCLLRALVSLRLVFVGDFHPVMPTNLTVPPQIILIGFRIFGVQISSCCFRCLMVQGLPLLASQVSGNRSLLNPIIPLRVAHKQYAFVHVKSNSANPSIEQKNSWQKCHS